jgi:GH15 family glucan-1,4-alpha-glucosidase
MEYKKFKEIKDYFIIGDLHTSALVSNNGSIDWLCLPHFDSPSIFASLLDNEKGGEFSINLPEYECLSKYEEDSAILNTIFTKKNLILSLKDFMLPQQIKKANSHFLVRKLNSIKGNHKIKFNYYPQPHYARLIPQIEIKANLLIMELEGESLILHLPKETIIDKTDKGYTIEFELIENQTKELVLEYYKKIHRKYSHNNLEFKTKMFWKKWIKKGKFYQNSRNNLVRSAITLKLLQYYPTGALVSAPTTSIPETINNERNWDYRYTWIRDSTQTIFAFYILGYKEEAKRFFKFIENTIISKDVPNDLEIFYTINGKLPPTEHNLEHFTGYKNSKPVRIGNDAVKQFQLDKYGSLIDAYYFAIKEGLRMTKGAKKIILFLAKEIIKNWKRPDNGIWEFRNEPQHYTYSKVMAWVGINRTIRLAKKLRINKKEIKKYQGVEQEIKKWIWDNCYNKKNEKMMQYPKSKYQDSTNFLLILLQFLDKHDPLTRKILENTKKELVSQDIFIRRYNNSDNLKGKEGAFILGSYWLISALAIIGDIEEAEILFEKAQKLLMGNGLMAEEIDSHSLEFLGNYPQSYSHLGYILSSHYINKYKKKFSQTI